MMGSSKQNDMFSAFEQDETDLSALPYTDTPEDILSRKESAMQKVDTGGYRFLEGDRFDQTLIDELAQRLGDAEEDTTSPIEKIYVSQTNLALQRIIELVEEGDKFILGEGLNGVFSWSKAKQKEFAESIGAKPDQLWDIIQGIQLALATIISHDMEEVLQQEEKISLSSDERTLITCFDWGGNLPLDREILKQKAQKKGLVLNSLLESLLAKGILEVIPFIRVQKEKLAAMKEPRTFLLRGETPPLQTAFALPNAKEQSYFRLLKEIELHKNDPDWTAPRFYRLTGKFYRNIL